MRVRVRNTVVSLIIGYKPSWRRRFFSRYGNGFTIWVGKIAMHFTKLQPHQEGFRK